MLCFSEMLHLHRNGKHPTLFCSVDGAAECPGQGRRAGGLQYPQHHSAQLFPSAKLCNLRHSGTLELCSWGS